MTPTEYPFIATVDGDWLTGPWRSPKNIAAQAAGTIHDDATARALGLRGGTVAGSIHMEQCVPVALARLGVDWHARGGLSLYFRNATQDGEPVRVRIGRGDGVCAPVEIRASDDVLVAEGTASLGKDDQSALRQRLRAVRPPTELRIMRDVRVGNSATRRGVAIGDARLAAHLPIMTEPQGIYRDERALPINLAIDLLRAAEADIAPLPDGVVGLYGAIELQMYSGPLRADTPYNVTGVVLALSDTPQTEAIWHAATAHSADGALVAEMLMMSRVMKASSPLWASGGSRGMA